MPLTRPSSLHITELPLAAERPTQSFGPAHRQQSAPVIACALGLLVFAPGTSALELGTASLKSGLGQPLHVEIPYRLAANERIAAACVALVPSAADALPTYTRASRIVLTATHIEIFDDRRVLEPLIGLNIAVRCDAAPHFVRSYELFVDPPAERREILSTGGAVADARQQPAIDVSAQRVTAREPLSNLSARARGQAGGNLMQGQTYRIVRGDTLSGIAARVVDRPGTIGETANVIFAANTAAFRRGNRDLIEAGRSITIPIMTPGTAARSATAPAATRVITPAANLTPAPSANLAPEPTANPAPTPNVAPVPAIVTPPRLVEGTARADAPAAIEPPAAPATEPTAAAPLRAALPPDAAAETAGRGWVGPAAAGLAALLFLGVLAVWSARSLLTRRRKQDAAEPVRGSARKSPPRRAVDPIAGIDVVEMRFADAAAHDNTSSIGAANSDRSARAVTGLPADLDHLALTIGPTDSVDLDVGAPIGTHERVDWFADRTDAAAAEPAAAHGAAFEENAATVRMPEVDAASVAAPKPDPAGPQIDDDRMTLTLVELDLLRQDYEAERTLTQQSSQALRDAVADLKATQAARALAADLKAAREAHAAADETTTLELPEQPQADSADDVQFSEPARVRMK